MDDLRKELRAKIADVDDYTKTMTEAAGDEAAALDGGWWSKVTGFLPRIFGWIKFVFVALLRIVDEVDTVKRRVDEIGGGQAGDVDPDGVSRYLAVELVRHPGEVILRQLHGFGIISESGLAHALNPGDDLGADELVGVELMRSPTAEELRMLHGAGYITNAELERATAIVLGVTPAPAGAVPLFTFPPAAASDNPAPAVAAEPLTDPYPQPGAHYEIKGNGRMRRVRAFQSKPAT